MAIIAILAAVAYPTYTGMRNRAYQAEAKAIMQEIRMDVWAQFVEDGKTAWVDGLYPVDIGQKVVGSTTEFAYDTTDWEFKGESSGADNNYTITATAKSSGSAKGDRVNLL
jgi:Tfp pilus assembly protein PilE